MSFRVHFVLSVALCAPFVPLGACFSDPGATSAQGSGDTDATGLGSSTAPNTTETDPTDTGSEETTETTETTGPDSLTGSESGPTSAGTNGPGTETDATGATSGETTSAGCEPVEVPIGSFSAGITQTFDLDFDDFPGTAGEEADLCATFVTSNWASARTITIKGEVLAFGPCGAWKPEPESFTGCASYIKPAGPAEVIIDNTPFSPGCQNGPMDDVVLSFRCHT
jgi:hypothetical protein